jgi:hypothetical protein
MAGTIVSDTIQNGAGATVPTTTVINGSAKAWVNFNGGYGNTAGVVNASYNVSSVTRTGTGFYTVNFTNAFVDANYVIQSNLQYANGSSTGSSNDVFGHHLQDNNPTTTACYVFSRSATSNMIDCFKFHVSCHR